MFSFVIKAGIDARKSIWRNATIILPMPRNDRALNLVLGLALAAIQGLDAGLAILPPALSAFVAFFGISWLGFETGRRLEDADGEGLPRPIAAILGVGILVATAATLQTALFYLGLRLGVATDALSEAAVFALAAAGLWFRPIVEAPAPETPEPEEPVGTAPWIVPAILASSAALLLAAIAAGAQGAATDASIRTPWPLLPDGSLVAAGLLWALSLAAAAVRMPVALRTLIAACALGGTVVVAPLVYRVGFGFDGFLHVASEQIVERTGTLSPKPPYYIGQYAATTWLARRLDLPLVAVDRWLAPIAAALLIPAGVALRRRGRGVWGMALLPLAAFVATTPQSLAYILGLVAVLGAAEWAVLLPFAAWSLTTHPLAGLPLALFAGAVFLARRQGAAPEGRIRSADIARLVGAALIALAAAVAVPAAFVWLGGRSGTVIAWKLDGAMVDVWKSWAASIVPDFGNAFAAWPAWSRLAAQGSIAALALAAGSSLRKSGSDRREAAVALLAAGALTLAAAVLKTAGDFLFLIDYERGNYADRLVTLAALVLFPAALPALAGIARRLRQEGPALAALAIAAAGTLGAGQTYASLPRHDALTLGRGWSVGRADIDAVRLIDADAGGRAYAVLANQSTSAAAVREFGFKRYVDDVFYYPIPTGGPLYEQFLQLVYREPSMEPIQEAARLTASERVYAVIDDYWNNAEALDESLSALADGTWTVGDPTAGLGHAARVYRFDLKRNDAGSTGAGNGTSKN